MDEYDAGLIVQIISAQSREFIEAFTGLRPRQFPSTAAKPHRAGCPAGRSCGPAV
ncbi:hypothetical protein ACWGLP_03935 [Streptomyces lydicus]